MSEPVRVRRRRRSRGRRRIRRAMVAAVLLTVALSGWIAVQQFGPPTSWFAAESMSTWEQGDPSHNLAMLASRQLWSGPTTQVRRPVYGYSLIAGGVRNVAELQQASERDPVLSEHYSGLDFHHAQLIEVDQPTLVYLSYKMKGKIYWTKGKHPLHKGEKLISDGKIKVRTRCANRVSDSAQKDVAIEEPPAEMFEVPFYPGGSAAELPYPGGLDSGLLARNDMPQFQPFAPPGSVPGGWGFPPIFPPPVPSACTPPDEKGPKKKNPCSGPPPPPVPEPGSMLLVSSGLVGIYWRYRKKNQS